MSSPSSMSRDQQFCLRWNNYQSNLTQVFNQLFQSESFVDVTLACEGHSVKAHRMVLSACSPYFLTVLSETPCSHPVIILQGVKWSELKAVVEFMYKGEINICQDQLSSLLRVAESLKIRGLADVGGEEAEAVLTSPSASPRVNSQFWSDETPRKRRRLSEEPRSRSRSRSPTPGPHTPVSICETLESMVDMPGGPLSRGSSSGSNPPPSLPSPSPVASLASSLSSLAHLHGPMPPPGPPLPPHLAHLPPLSPLSPLLNMHPMSRHHSPEDFEIRPGIAEMIREEERRRRDFPDMAKLLESTHHWIGNPMADGEASVTSVGEDKSFVPANEAVKMLNLPRDDIRNFESKQKNPSKTQEKETSLENLGYKIDSSVKLGSKSKNASKWTQDDLTMALMMVRNGTPIKPAAVRFNIPVMTLWRRTRALGLVSSKVQCGFRYSASRNTFSALASHYKSKDEDFEKNCGIPCYKTTENFSKERSPLTESNTCKVLRPSEDPPSPKIIKEEEEPSHKENSPEFIRSSFYPSVGNGIKISPAYNSCTDEIYSDPNSKVPPKEFLVWLSCLGRKLTTKNANDVGI